MNKKSLLRTSNEPSPDLIANLKALFNPVRGADETQKAFKIRRKNSHTYLSNNAGRWLSSGDQTSRQRFRLTALGRKAYGAYGRYLRDFVTAKNLMKIRYGS